MINNPIRSAFDFNLQQKDFLDSLSQLQKLSNVELIVRGLVLDVDRVGGRFIINRSGGGGNNNQYSTPFTLKIRLLTNNYNLSDGTDDTFVDADEYFVLPLNTNIIDIPERGEIVRILFNKPFTDGINVIGVWIGRETSFATRDLYNIFKRQEASIGKDIVQSQASIYGGTRPQNIDNDYDIKPNWNYEPFPDLRLKAGDIEIKGKSNTHIQQTFDAYKDDTINADSEKRGIILLETELDYIQNINNASTSGLTEFDYNTATDSDIADYQSMVRTHNALYLDFGRDKSRWEFLNSKGSRIMLATKTNVDARLIHKMTEKDWTGTYGNVQKLYDKNYRDEGPGDNCGQEIQQDQLNDKIDFQTTNGDVTTVKANPRDPITFDECVATIYMESEEFRFISRDGKDVNHAVLAEVQGRFLERMLMLIMHMTRTTDLLNDRLHKLGNDFLVHFHSLVPGSTQQPLGSPNTQNFIDKFQWYDNTTSGGSVGDSGTFDQSGSDSPDEGMIKNRITEERNIAEQLIQEIPEHHSKNFSLN